MKNILFYGNCQLECIKNTMNLPSTMCTNTFIPCFSTLLSEIEFDDILKQSDIVITQPICDNYRDKYYLASNYVVNKCKEGAIVIFVNNCHFDFYYLDLIYDKSDKYSHTCMMDCIEKNLGVDYYRQKYVENDDLKSVDELQVILDSTLMSLKNHYESMLQYKKPYTHFINIIPFIEENFKEKLLFYTFNHPSKHLLQFIALEIVKILNLPNTINRQLDHFSLDRYILYSCIQKIVHFDVEQCKPFIHGNSDLNTIYNSYMKSNEEEEKQ